MLVKSSGQGTFTDSSGHFAIRGVPAGQDTVEVGLIGFAREQVPLSLEAGHVTQVTFMLSQTVLRVEDIRVEVERKQQSGKLAGFYERMQSGLGTFLTPEEIQKRNVGYPSDYLTGVRGVDVGPTEMGHADVRIARGGSRCAPNYYVDGVFNRGLRIDQLNRDDILAIEVYRGPSETPLKFAFPRTDCGVIVIWTREGRDERGATEGQR